MYFPIEGVDRSLICIVLKLDLFSNRVLHFVLRYQ